MALFWAYGIVIPKTQRASRAPLDLELSIVGHAFHAVEIDASAKAICLGSVRACGGPAFIEQSNKFISIIVQLVTLRNGTIFPTFTITLRIGASTFEVVAGLAMKDMPNPNLTAPC
jgi:hypothetical protein